MNVDGQEFKAALRRLAGTLGGVAFGVTEAAPVADHERYRLWLDRGWHGALRYLERDGPARADPRHLLPEAQSVLCVALPHALPAPLPSHQPGTSGAKAALFAGRDYHRVTRAVLDALAAEGARLSGEPSVWLPAVDTRPLLERSLAMRAGLGSVGRNTQLIVPGHGSLVCLGLLLTDVALPPDPPSRADLCGTCSACLSACPTGALHDGQGLEAPRCLSYLTTASREAIPLELRPKLGLRVYGCDDCQSACPWNRPPRLAAHAPHPALAGERQIPRETLESWLSASGRRLRRELEGTALAYLSPAALRRTACIVLGNLGDPASRPALQQAKEHPTDLGLAEHASWALDRLPPSPPEAAGDVDPRR